MKNYANRPRLISDCNPQLPEAVQTLTANVDRPDRPTWRLKDLLELRSVSRRKTYELHWTAEAVDRIDGRANTFCAQREGN